MKNIIDPHKAKLVSGNAKVGGIGLQSKLLVI